ncbi:MAG: hypothetical protein JJ899_11070 [Alphaproteobacteria bacterium]|nr:hypothetical protein [Alphaproteobacteria bacterium]
MSVNALRNIVIVLGVLIVIALAAVVWGIVDASRRAGNGENAAPREAAAPGTPRTVDLGLPAACEILSAEPDGPRLVVTTGGAPDVRAVCARVFVINTNSGTVRMTVQP